jgi:hypothetical protein
MAKAKSRRQARLFGAVAGGQSTKAKGMSKKQAKNSLRGVRVKSLPKTAKKKGK